MSRDVGDAQEMSGVFVISAWREGHDRPLVLRVTASHGEEERASFVTASQQEAQAAVRDWLADFGDDRGKGD